MKATMNYRGSGIIPAPRMEVDSKEKRYYRQAKFLLETFNENRLKKSEVEGEIRKGCRFTREDAIYMIAGVKAVQYNADRVQSSGKPDRMADKVLNIDEVVERMNREASNELTKEYGRLSARIALVNTGICEMDALCRRLIRQRYVEGIPVDSLIDQNGRKYRYKKAMAILHDGIQQFADYLMLTDTVRSQMEVKEQKNEYLEEDYE